MSMGNYTKRDNDILFYLFQNPNASIKEITPYVYRKNPNVVEKGCYVKYKCMKCNRIYEKRKSKAIRPVCSEQIGNKRCRGKIIIIEEKKTKIHPRRYSQNYSGAIKQRNLNKLQKANIISYNNGYKINLEGIFELLTGKNSRFVVFANTKFYDGKKSEMVLTLFNKFVNGAYKVMERSEKQIKESYKDIAQHFNFLELFMQFIYYFGRNYLFPQKRKKCIANLLNIEKNKNIISSFIANCFFTWHTSTEAILDTIGDNLAF